MPFQSRAIATLIFAARLRIEDLLRPICSLISPSLKPCNASDRSNSSSAGVQARAGCLKLPFTGCRLGGPVDERVMQPAPGHLVSKSLRTFTDAWAVGEMVLIRAILVRQVSDLLIIFADAPIRDFLETHM